VSEATSATLNLAEPEKKLNSVVTPLPPASTIAGSAGIPKPNPKKGGVSLLARNGPSDLGFSACRHTAVAISDAFLDLAA
jgi:hypothetical protein